MEETDFLQWLEDSLRPAMERRPVYMGVVICWDEQTFTGYYHAGAPEKAMMANHIQSDAVMDLIRMNAGLIKEILEGDEDDQCQEDP